MSFEERTKRGRTYYYFEYSDRGKRQYLYLGSLDAPKKKNIEKAIAYVRSQTNHYQNLEGKLLRILEERRRRQEAILKSCFYLLERLGANIRTDILAQASNSKPSELRELLRITMKQSKWLGENLVYDSDDDCFRLARTEFNKLIRPEKLSELVLEGLAVV